MKCITLGFWLWGRPWLLVLCTEVTYGKGSVLTERNLDTLLLLSGTIFSYFCMSSITSVLILAILIAIVLFY